MWVVDDPAVGLSKKPSIAAIDTMIDKVVAHIPNAEHGFRAIFSAFPFPGSIFRLEWRREETGRNRYYSDQKRVSNIKPSRTSATSSRALAAVTARG